MLLILSNNFAYTYENKILFKVNNKIITSLDILNEINYLNSINKNLKNLENEKIYQIAKNSMIIEKIKETFMLKIYQKIELNDEDFDRLILENYSNLKIVNKDELNLYLKNYNLDYISLKKKVSISTFWNQFIYSKYAKNININVDDIKKEILKNDEQKEFLMSEILFGLEDSENLERKFLLIEEDIAKNGFENSALIFSISESAKKGGKIGWVKENSINSKILKSLSKIKISEHTKPIVVPGGFLILKINEIKKTKRDINLEKELEMIIRAKTNNQLNQYSNIFLNKIKKEMVIDEF